MLALASSAIAQPTAGTPPIALLAPEAGNAVLWRAAGRRLQVELNALPEAGRSAALVTDVAAWRNGAPAARAEAALTLELARRWFAAIQAGIPTARWPGGRPAQAYAAFAPRELLAAWTELEQAAAAGASPQAALVRAWRVRDWLRGLDDLPTPFDTLETDAIEAIIGAAAPGPGDGPPLAASALPPETAVAGLLFAQAGGDRVGARGAQPDGAPDISLNLLAVHRGRTVARIDLVPLDAGNRPCCGRRWSSGDPAAEFLGAISGNVGNGQGFAAALPGFGDQILLIANDGPAFQVGARLAAIIRYTDGSQDHAVLEVPAWARR